MSLSILPLFTALSATLTITAHYLRPARPRLIYLFKPLTTLLILITALLPGTFLSDRYAGAIALGLIFGLGGDILLMLPGNYFLYGLVSFLIGHLCYWAAFFPDTFGVDFFWPLLPLLILGGLILRYLWPGLTQELKVPVMLYVSVIMGMGVLAVYRAFQFPTPATYSAAVGALLFLVSDITLAVNRFRRPFALVHLAVLSTYFAGQILIASSIPLGVY